MISTDEIQSILSKQSAYFSRSRSNQTYHWNDFPELPSAWLKRLFASFNYHEKLIEIHYIWMNYIKDAIERHNLKDKDPVNYNFFIKKAIPNFEKIAKPGQLDPEKWIPGQQAGFANSIGYYDKNTGLDMKHTWEWLNKEEEYFIHPIWGYMGQMSSNIMRTVQKKLGSRYSGRRLNRPHRLARQLER